MYKINLKVFLIVFFLCCACSKEENKVEKFSPKIIDLISKEDFSYPSAFNPFLFFGRCGNDKIAILHPHELKKIHELQYRDLKFIDFLSKVLDESITINCSDKYYSFKIDSSVYKLYKKENFANFSMQYCDRMDSNTFILKKNLSKQKMNSVFYLFFKHNYLSYFNDKIGRYYLRNTKTILDNI